MFYVLHGPGNTTKSFGFAPSEHGSMNGPGEVMKTDASEYKDPRYSRTLEISEEQYRKLEEFGAHPDKLGFDLQYKDVRNNCVDVTWAAPNHAGIERKRSIDVNMLGGGIGQMFPDVRIPLNGLGEGKDGYRPLRNIHGVESIDPPFPGSELNRKKINDMPKRSFQQHILSDADGVGERNGEHLVGHSNDPLFLQINQGVARLDAEAGRSLMPPAKTSAPVSTRWPRPTTSPGSTTCCSVNAPCRLMRRRTSSSCRASAMIPRTCVPAWPPRWRRRHRQLLRLSVPNS